MNQKELEEEQRLIAANQIKEREMEEIRRQYQINQFEMCGRGSINSNVFSSTNNLKTQPETQ